MSNQQYDVAIIGAGTSGLEIAKNASRCGFKVCLIEQGHSEGKVNLIKYRCYQANYCKTTNIA